MSVIQVRNQYRQLLASIGRAALHNTFPNDVEYYACSFELTDYFGNLVDMLVFPIMPQSITESTTTIANVKKGTSAVVSLFNPSFVPFNIQINGNFGRKFRLLVGQGEIVDGVAFRFTSDTSDAEFNVQVKSGYGVMKILQRIIERSFTIDDEGRPYKLFFNNQAFNSNHFVEIIQYSFSQNEQMNTIWNYNITMRALAPALAIRDPSTLRTSLRRLLLFDNATKALNLLTGQALDGLARFRRERLL